MATKEYIETLRIRKQELVKELDLINQLLETVGEISTIADAPRVIRKEGQENGAHTSFKYPSKGDQTWEDYVLLLLKVAGKSKSGAISKIAMNANPDLEAETIRTAVRHHLSRLFREKKILGEGNEKRKSSGYVYWIKE